MADIGPTLLPEIRDETAAWMLHSPRAQDSFIEATRARRTGLRARAYGKLLHQVCVGSLAAAELYWVAPPLVTLAVHAAESLPPYAIAPWDLPSRYGLIVLANPAERVRALLWASHADLLYAFTLTDRTTKDYPRLTVVPGSYAVAPLMRTAESQATTGRTPELLLALLALMKQKIVTHGRPRPEQTTCAEPTEPPPVRLIDLRHGEHTGDAEPSERTWHHSWIVKGHWRHQFYPSLGDHRPIWISPHLKGDLDKPLLGGEKVYVLRHAKETR